MVHKVGAGEAKAWVDEYAELCAAARCKATSISDKALKSFKVG